MRIPGWVIGVAVGYGANLVAREYAARNPNNQVAYWLDQALDYAWVVTLFPGMVPLPGVVRPLFFGAGIDWIMGKTEELVARGMALYAATEPAPVASGSGDVPYYVAAP